MHGALVDFKNEHGETALMKACETGDLESVRLLLSCNANVTIESEEHIDIAQRDHPKRTALDIAEEKGHAEIIALLKNV